LLPFEKRYIYSLKNVMQKYIIKTKKSQKIYLGTSKQKNTQLLLVGWATREPVAKMPTPQDWIISLLEVP
jgi:hypothetical protein